MFVSQEWVQAEITVAIKFRVNLINFRTLSLTSFGLANINRYKSGKTAEI